MKKRQNLTNICAICGKTCNRAYCRICFRAIFRTLAQGTAALILAALTTACSGSPLAPSTLPGPGVTAPVEWTDCVSQSATIRRELDTLASKDDGSGLTGANMDSWLQLTARLATLQHFCGEGGPVDSVQKLPGGNSQIRGKNVSQGSLVRPRPYVGQTR